MAFLLWPVLRVRNPLAPTFKLLVTATCILSCTLAFAATDQRKAKWFRFYDSNGVANISSSVTPNHIRFGYEALDQNLQVIYKNKPFNAEAESRAANERQIASLEQQYDQRLKRAYGSSKTATLKREQQLASINRQMIFQQQQLRTLMNEKVNYKRQELAFLRKGANVPPSLQQRLQQNEKEIATVRNTIENLQIKLRDTHTEYEKIIRRLKALES